MAVATTTRPLEPLHRRSRHGQARQAIPGLLRGHRVHPGRPNYEPDPRSNAGGSGERDQCASCRAALAESGLPDERAQSLGTARNARTMWRASSSWACAFTRRKAAARPARASLPVSHSRTCEDDNRIFLVAGEPVAGFLCGVLTPHYFTGEPTAFKTAWYAIPGARGLWSPSPARVRGLGQGKRRAPPYRGRTARANAGPARPPRYAPLETVTSKDLPWQKQPFPSS